MITSLWLRVCIGSKYTLLKTSPMTTVSRPRVTLQNNIATELLRNFPHSLVHKQNNFLLSFSILAWFASCWFILQNWKWRHMFTTSNIWTTFVYEVKFTVFGCMLQIVCCYLRLYLVAHDLWFPFNQTCWTWVNLFCNSFGRSFEFIYERMPKLIDVVCCKYL